MGIGQRMAAFTNAECARAKGRIAECEERSEEYITRLRERAQADEQRCELAEQRLETRWRTFAAAESEVVRNACAQSERYTELAECSAAVATPPTSMTGKAATESADQSSPAKPIGLVREKSGESLLRFFVDTTREKPTRPVNLARSKSADTQRKLLGNFGGSWKPAPGNDDAAAALRAAGAALEAPCEVSPNPLSDADKTQNTSHVGTYTFNSPAIKQAQRAGEVLENNAVTNGQKANAGDIEEAKATKNANATHLDPSSASIPGVVADTGKEPQGQVASVRQEAPQASSTHANAVEGTPVKHELSSVSSELKVLKGVIAVLLLFVVIVAILAGVIVVRSL